MKSAATKPQSTPLTNPVHIEVGLTGRDRVTLDLDLQNGVIQAAKMTGSGCTHFLKLIQAWRPKLNGELSKLPLPEGSGHAEILLREAILKAKGEWQFPYDEEELCHCRAIATSKVDAAIISGCHNIRSVARETSAGTSCGSCRPNTEAMIEYRLKGK